MDLVITTHGAYRGGNNRTIRPVTQYVYDTLSRRTQVKAGHTPDPTGQSSAADVPATQLTSAYDDFGRKIKETDALAKFTVYEYDANNNLVKSTDAKGQLTQYTWDTGHQLKTIKDQNNNTITYTRNALGQVTQTLSPAVTYRYQYDISHRLNQVTDSRASKALSYAYSPGGLLNKMLDSDGNQTDYLYDPVGRLTGIWAPNYDYTSFSYDAGGRLTEKWFPNGVDSQFAWNKDNTLKQIVNRLSSASLVSQHDYTYDALGNRATHTEKVGATTLSYSYLYDALNRLTQVQNGNAATQENYAYDPLGNRTSKTVNATTPSVTAYIYDQANQLKEIHQTNATGPLLASLAYDLNGSLVTKTEGATVTNLTYDALNRLTQVAKTGLPTQTYAYDDSGRRIAKTIGTATTNFLYGGPDIVAEYAAAWGNPIAQYTHGPNPDEPIERITATAAQYFHHDGLGSVVGVTNNLGGTDATQRFDAWGNKVASTGTGPRYGYTGREPDETGLVYYRARYYDPAVGRFTQRDPIGLGGGINQYAYVNGNPVNFTDPEGLFVPQLLGGLFNTGVGAAVTYSTGGGTWQQYARNAAADFTVGALSSGVAGLAKVATLAKAAQFTNTTLMKATTAVSAEVYKGMADGKNPVQYGTNAALAGVLNATGVVGKAATAAAKELGYTVAGDTLNPGVAALLQPKLGDGAFVKEAFSSPGNYVAGVGSDYLGTAFGGGGASSGQSIPAMTTPDSTAGGLFSNPDSLCIVCMGNYSSGGFSNQGGKLKF